MRSPRLTRAMLVQLAKDRSPALRMHVARHPDAPVSTQIPLLGDPDDSLGMAVLSQPQLLPAIYEAVAHSKDLPIKLGVLCRQQVPEEVVLALLDTKNIH